MDGNSSNKLMKIQEEDEEIQTLQIECQSWCGSNGLVMVASDRTNGSWQHAPLSMLPASFPSSAFQQAVDLAKPFNVLVDRVARDSNYLTKALEDAVIGDEFTKRLMEIFDKFGGEKARQKTYLGIHRSDYMVDSFTNRLLQVELNTISASFACLSARVSRLHRHLLTENPATLEACRKVDERFQDVQNIDSKIPNNTADVSIPNALAKAHEVYIEKCKASKHETCLDAYVLFVVQEGERNYVDQRHLEYALATTHKVPVLRRTMAQIEASGRIIEPSGALILDDNKEISVVYFRAGYTPSDYPTEIQWKVRELIESSLAIKCPSIAYHLVGAKKVQQRLADAGVLEMFISDDYERKKLRACFAGLWSMGHDFDPKIKEMAIKNPGKYVVKPQREGGGNNIYGENVRTALETMNAKEMAAHILMERIFPPREPALLMRNGEVKRGEALSELGIYSVYLGDGKVCYLNNAAGHLLRTKFDGVDEGGVASGFATLNSPFLV
jgi:glutathione synthetase